jgi:hypothetical protein
MTLSHKSRIEQRQAAKTTAKTTTSTTTQKKNRAIFAPG